MTYYLIDVVADDDDFGELPEDVDPYPDIIPLSDILDLYYEEEPVEFDPAPSGSWSDVYRVEHDPSGVGPYNCAMIDIREQNAAMDALFLTIDDDLYGDSDPSHPSPFTDGLPARFPLHDRRKDWRFGFESLDSLRAWFCNGSLEKLLDEAHFVIRHYEVPSEYVHVLTHQVVFSKAAAHIGANDDNDNDRVD